MGSYLLRDERIKAGFELKCLRGLRRMRIFDTNDSYALAGTIPDDDPIFDRSLFLSYLYSPSLFFLDYSIILCLILSLSFSLNIMAN